MFGKKVHLLLKNDNLKHFSKKQALSERLCTNDLHKTPLT